MATISGAIIEAAGWRSVQGTITADAQGVYNTVTWNAGGVTFTGWLLDITSTASAAASLAINVKVGGATVFSVRKDGGIVGALLTAAQPNVTSVGTLTSLTVSGAIGASDGAQLTPSISFSADTDTGFYRGAANLMIAVAGNTEAFRWTTTAITVAAGITTAVQALTATEVAVSGGAAGAGKMWATAAGGLIIQVKTGSVTDWQVNNPGNTGSYITAATGTLNLTFGGSGAFAAGITSTTGIHTAAAPTVAAAQVGYGATTQTTIGANGAASALTANPVGYLIINVAGNNRIIPYYNP